MDEGNYNVRYAAKYPTTTKPAIYENDIPNNAMNVVWAKAVLVYTVKIADYQLFAAVKSETRYFILVVVEDNWVR